MSEADIARVKEQERRLVLPVFGEEAAFRLGLAIRDRAFAQGWPIVVDVRTFDRPLFYAALPGSTADNANWARRKFNTVRQFLCSTYRLVLEQKSPDRAFKTGFGLPVTDYVLAGGGFPVTVEGAGVIGAIMVSGLPERQDHAVIVHALCARLGVDPQELALEG
ncbi:MAG TPA: heme-degrading domain-containing protein [Mesorhizobium sp.]|jgi:uncharacterized protein (UPF0303 family)|nr:heme-degrading domain-containing protein [Mesorhizobium sp.]